MMIGNERLVRLSTGPVADGVGDVALALAREMRDKHGWRGARDGFQLQESWVKTSSQNVFHRLTSVPAGEGIVLKMASNGSKEVNADRMADSMLDLADMLDHAGQGVTSLRPIGWLASPSVLATPYVEGVDLVDLLRDGNRAAWEHEEIVFDAVRAAGVALATFHASMGDVKVDDRSTARDEAVHLARRLALPPRTASMLRSEADGVATVGRTYGDFGPGNIRLGHSGDVYVLDPPALQRVGLRHRDIAYFDFEVKKNLAGHGGDQRSRPVRGRESQIRATFLDGYRAVSSFDPTREAAQAAIAAFQAVRCTAMARKRTRQRRWGDVMWALASTAKLRRRTVRATTGT